MSVHKVINSIILKFYIVACLLLVSVLRHTSNSFLLYHVLEEFEGVVLLLVDIDYAPRNHSREDLKLVQRLLKVSGASKVVHILNEVGLSELGKSIQG